MHDGHSVERVKWLQQVVRGYFQYHAVPGNEERLRGVSARSEANSGCGRYGAEVSAPAGRGSDSWSDSATCYLRSKSYIPIRRALRRQTSKAGTVCVSRASTGLCGGQRVTAVPTATSRLSAGACRARRLAQGTKEPPERRLRARLPAPHCGCRRKAISYQLSAVSFWMKTVSMRLISVVSSASLS